MTQINRPGYDEHGKKWDYSNLGGGQAVTPQDQYGDMAEKLYMYGVRVACEHHQFARPVFACRHCTPGTQDQSRPVGMVFMPKHYYMCFKCYYLYEAKRFDRGTELIVVCRECVADEWKRILHLKPDKVRDLTLPGVSI